LIFPSGVGEERGEPVELPDQGPEHLSRRLDATFIGGGFERTSRRGRCRRPETRQGPPERVGDEADLCGVPSVNPPTKPFDAVGEIFQKDADQLDQQGLVATGAAKGGGQVEGRPICRRARRFRLFSQDSRFPCSSGSPESNIANLARGSKTLGPSQSTRGIPRQTRVYPATSAPPPGGCHPYPERPEQVRRDPAQETSRMRLLGIFDFPHVRTEDLGRASISRIWRKYGDGMFLERDTRARPAVLASPGLLLACSGARSSFAKPMSRGPGPGERGGSERARAPFSRPC
jgi:hypothetical protein